MLVHGQHTGSNLADILLKVLQQQNIINRVIVITTDNASNNKTLVNSLYDSIERIELPNFTEIIQVLYLTYMIQLSLKDLLSLIKADLKNDKTATV